MKGLSAKKNSARTIICSLALSVWLATADQFLAIALFSLIFLFIGIGTFAIRSNANVSLIRILYNLYDRRFSTVRFHVKHSCTLANSLSEDIGVSVFYSGTIKAIELIKSKMSGIVQAYNLLETIADKRCFGFRLPDKKAFLICKIRSIIVNLKSIFIHKRAQLLSFFTFLFTFPKVLLIEPYKEVSNLKSKILTLLTFRINGFSLKRMRNQVKGDYFYFIEKGICKFIGRVIGIRTFFSFFYKLKKIQKYSVYNMKQIQIELVLSIQEKELISGFL